MFDGAKSAKFVRHTSKNVRLIPHNRLIENLEKTVYYVYNRFCKKVNDKDMPGLSNSNFVHLTKNELDAPCRGHPNRIHVL